MWHSFGLPGPPTEIPVDPTAPEARRWAEEELSREAYNPNPGNIFTRIGEWIMDFLGGLFSGQVGNSNPLVTALILIFVVLAVILTLLYASRVRRVRRVTTARTSHALFDDARPSAELLSDARAALARGDFSAAFLDGYRAIIRSLDERVLIDDRPGLTAQEASGLALTPFPDFAPTWSWAATTFDAVCYGTHRAREADVRSLLDFGQQVAAARPVGSAAVVA